MGKSLIITTGGGTDVEEGSPNALPPVVLSGYTFYAKNDDPMVGEMENHSELSDAVLEPEEELIISPGYHSGEQVIAAVSLTERTVATAEDSGILSGYSGWNHGAEIFGIMPNQGATLNEITANGTYNVPAGWHNGLGKITQTLSTQAATSVIPGISQKTVIDASAWTTGAQTVLGSGSLVAGNIRKGVAIFGVVGSYEGEPTYIAISSGGMHVHQVFDSSDPANWVLDNGYNMDVPLSVWNWVTIDNIRTTKRLENIYATPGWKFGFLVINKSMSYDGKNWRVNTGSNPDVNVINLGEISTFQLNMIWANPWCHYCHATIPISLQQYRDAGATRIGHFGIVGHGLPTAFTVWFYK